MTPTLGQIIRSFFEDYLRVQKGLRPTSLRSYRDAVRLFLGFTSKDAKCRISRLSVRDLTFERTLAFLRHLEANRHNHIRTRNQRLAALKTLFEYLGGRLPEMLDTCQRVAAIPAKRVAPPETHFLEREALTSLLERLPTKGCYALRDRTLLLFLYNTGARVQEVADLRAGNLDLNSQPRVHLHGKGDKWRLCPLWTETVRHLQALGAASRVPWSAQSPVFCSRPGVPLTRFGIYRIVRRHAGCLDTTGADPWHVTPHTFRHTAAVHLLEAGVEINVIRAWLGHVSLDTTNRYAELTLRAKEAAVRACEPPSESSKGALRQSIWKEDERLLAWLAAL